MRRENDRARIDQRAGAQPDRAVAVVDHHLANASDVGGIARGNLGARIRDQDFGIRIDSDDPGTGLRFGIGSFDPARRAVRFGRGRRNLAGAILGKRGLRAGKQQRGRGKPARTTERTVQFHILHGNPTKNLVWRVMHQSFGIENP